jgi:hypothetical protein
VVIVGRVADFKGAKGGGVQFFIPRTQGFDFDSYPLVRDQPGPTDVVVKFVDAQDGDVFLRARVKEGTGKSKAATSQPAAQRQQPPAAAHHPG